MDMLSSLCAAMVRANGECLVLESGRPPYVVAGSSTTNVAKATLSDNALEALVGQIFTEPGRDAFRGVGRVVEDVDVPSAGLTLQATAERSESGIMIELRKTPTYAIEELAPAEPHVDETLFAAPERPLPSAVQMTGWENTPGLFVDSAPTGATVDPADQLGLSVEHAASYSGGLHGEAPQGEGSPAFEDAAQAGVVEASSSFEAHAYGHEPPAHEPAVYEPAVYEPAVYEPTAYEAVVHESAAYETPVFEPLAAAEPEDAPAYESAPVYEPPAYAVPEPAFEAALHVPTMSVDEEPIEMFVPPVPVEGRRRPDPPAPARAWAPPAATRQPAAVPVADTDLLAFATQAAAAGAAVVYLRAGSPPIIRVEDRLEPLTAGALDRVAVNQLLGDLEDGGDPTWQRAADDEWARLHATLGRLSCRIFSDDEGRGLILRLQARAADGNLVRLVPRKVRAACDGEGLIVVAAPGPDEALAMAGGVADLAARRRGGYVVVLRPAGSPRPQVAGAFVSQREFEPGAVAGALRSAVAEAPDILVLAMSQTDGVTREIARASEGGRLVIVSVAAPTSLQAVRTLVGRGASVGDAQVRLSLATGFRAAFSTRTLRRLGGGRTTIQDLLLGTSEVAGLVAAGDFAGVMRLQRQGSAGMFTVDERLAGAVRRGLIPLRQAVEHALDRRHLVSLVRASGRTARRLRNGSYADEPTDAFEAGRAGAGAAARRW